jgi:hypothetical protein
MINMDPEDDEDSSELHALFEFDLGFISVPTRKFDRLKGLFLSRFKNETDINCTAD